ncbi:uncharacterized protein LOC134966468 [Pseudophryne corroboree]|uniref:uncharacterized protein LOC134966468 n=1 Tax=Pseudophryne corroboree TaxID=495146 RepID=UPI003081CC87
MVKFIQFPGSDDSDGSEALTFCTAGRVRDGCSSHPPPTACVPFAGLLSLIRINPSEHMAQADHEMESTIMYHGTTVQAATLIIIGGFQVSPTGMLGKGVYVSRDPEKAERYPLSYPKERKVVLKLSIKMGKVLKITHQGHPLQYTWHDRGYDSAWVPPECGMVPSGLEEACVYDPGRITVIDVYSCPPKYIDALKSYIGNPNALTKENYPLVMQILVEEVMYDISTRQ